MGKASKWFRSLLRSKKSPPESSNAAAAPPWNDKKKSKWARSKSAELSRPYGEGLDDNKHAIAVAAATAAVAEAALAAAHAAAEVVRLTGGCGSGRNAVAYVGGDRRLVEAAVKIQSAFRAYLARRALRALKGLVKLQALMRGHIVRKQSADMLRRMQAMARIQARASAHRSYVSETPKTNVRSSSSRHLQGTVNSRTYNHGLNNAKQGGSITKQYNRRFSNTVNKESSHLASNWLDHWMEHTSLDLACLDDDTRSDKILEIDTWKPSSRLSSKLHKPIPSISSEEVSSIRSPNFPSEVPVWMAEISPSVRSTSSRPNHNRGLFTPARSECSRSLFGDYIGSHRNYMANTESSRAKVRSQSAPRQRMQIEELRSSGIFSHGLRELDVYSEKGFTLPANHRNNSYLHSGQLKRQGTPACGGPNGFNSTYGYRL